ncbi:MAG TPA: hypothetical protein VHV10_04590, partial [Ktedonobacteraceae bacterium]|nr:hypothetical protein [Ktedonobacteraceae bacterium]
MKREEILSDIDFKLGTPLHILGQVRNHDILIPHPGPMWIINSLASDLNTVLGPGSKAYILTDTADSQKDQLISKLQQFEASLHVRVTPIGDGQSGDKIDLGR